MASGWAGDRVDPRYLIAVGMWLGAAAQFAFGALVYQWTCY
jgi:hypothetical protein